jgi:hypothetical protein
VARIRGVGAADGIEPGDGASRGSLGRGPVSAIAVVRVDSYIMYRLLFNDASVGDGSHGLNGRGPGILGVQALDQFFKILVCKKTGMEEKEEPS